MRILPSEITPEHVFWNRREFLGAAAGLALSQTAFARLRPTSPVFQ